MLSMLIFILTLDDEYTTIWIVWLCNWCNHLWSYIQYGKYFAVQCWTIFSPGRHLCKNKQQVRLLNCHFKTFESESFKERVLLWAQSLDYKINSQQILRWPCIPSAIPCRLFLYHITRFSRPTNDMGGEISTGGEFPPPFVHSSMGGGNPSPLTELSHGRGGEFTPPLYLVLCWTVGSIANHWFFL